MILLFLILCMLGLPHLGLGANVNRIAAIVLIVVGVFVAFTGFDASLKLNVD